MGSEHRMLVPGGKASRHGASIAVLLSVVLAVSACASANESASPGASGAAESADATSGVPSTAPANAGPQVLRINWQTFPVLDPHILTSGMWLWAMGLGEGLVSQNSDGTDVIPAAADRWDVSADGLTWTFHIRDSLTWSDGTPLTAEDFVASYKRLLDPERGEAGVSLGSNPYRLGLGITGAEAYLAGQTKDFSTVGISASSPSELVFTLQAPNPVFLLGLTHPSMFPVPTKNIEANPSDWEQPSKWVGSGPFVPSAWTVNSSLTMKPNENYWDRANVHLTEVDVKLADQATPAAMIAFENDEIDVATVSDADLPRLQADPQQSTNLVVVPGAAVWFLHILRSQNPILEDLRVRKALALGMGREAISSIIPGTKPGVSLVPNNVPGWDPAIAIKEDVEAAKQLLADAGYPNGEGMPTLNIMTDAPYPVLEAVVDQWKKNLNVTAKLDTIDIGVYVERRFAVQPPDYVGFVYNTYGGQEPNWTYNMTATWPPNNIKNYSLPASVWQQYLDIEADTTLDPAVQTQQLTDLREANASAEAKRFGDLLDQATAEKDPTAQVALLNQAAKARDETYLVQPVLWADAVWIKNPRVQNIDFRLTLEQFYLKGVSIAAQ